MSVNLSKGQKLSLTKATGGTLTRVRMGLGWAAMKKRGFFGKKEQEIDLDASGLLFDAAGNLVVKVDGKLAAAADGKGIYDGVAAPTKTVTCRVYSKRTLAEADWNLVAEQTITVGGEAAAIAVPGAAQAASGFYKAVITK